MSGAVAGNLRLGLQVPVRRLLETSQRRVLAVAGQMRRRWHRSLQLRVIASTLAISAVVVAVLGFFLIEQIAGGLLAKARTAALTQTADGLAVASPGLTCRGRTAAARPR